MAKKKAKSATGSAIYDAEGQLVETVFAPFDETQLVEQSECFSYR